MAAGEDGEEREPLTDQMVGHTGVIIVAMELGGWSRSWGNWPPRQRVNCRAPNETLFPFTSPRVTDTICEAQAWAGVGRSRVVPMATTESLCSCTTIVARSTPSPQFLISMSCAPIVTLGMSNDPSSHVPTAICVPYITSSVDVTCGAEVGTLPKTNPKRFESELRLDVCLWVSGSVGARAGAEWILAHACGMGETVVRAQAGSRNGCWWARVAGTGLGMHGRPH